MSVRAMAHFALPDDTEEELVGADWHQAAIVHLYDSLIDLADRRGLPWHVGNQLTLVAWAPSGDAWRPSPDIMVHPDAGPMPRKEMVAAESGVPALVIEVASETTWRYDVNVKDGKAAGYHALGVSEYLVFDPTGDYLPERCRGWRHPAGTTEPWQPTHDGRYESGSLGLSLQPDGLLLRVLDGQGRPIPSGLEKARRIATLEAELAQLRAQMDAQRRPHSDDGGAR